MRLPFVVRLSETYDANIRKYKSEKNQAIAASSQILIITKLGTKHLSVLANKRQKGEDDFYSFNQRYYIHVVISYLIPFTEEYSVLS